MENSTKLKWILCSLVSGLISTATIASDKSFLTAERKLGIQKQTGFFRFSYDKVKMPNNIHDMGLFGANYFADITPTIYGGIGGYGSITGTQGGLFVLGFEGGIHKQFAEHWWIDSGLFLGGGGGRSSLVGGGLMIKPHAGIAYGWEWARLGLHYSYIAFPSGKIHSQQIGVDLDIPYDFYYIPFQDCPGCYSISQLFLCDGKYPLFERNDFAILLQAYWQRPGTLNVNHEVQDGTIGVVGAEFDHYLNDKWFWWIRADGAYRGIPNGYMDILGGLGYHAPLLYGVALVPQLGVGAGGGGNVDSGGGVIVQPQLGIEFPLSPSFAARFAGGYLWAPKGSLSAYTGTGALIYHMDTITASCEPCLFTNVLIPQNWRLQLANQTYLHPQRANWNTSAPINLVVFQIDQFFNSMLFMSYQAAFAYSGAHAGGYATGMIGPGLQTPYLFNTPLQLFGTILIGAGGGGNLALGGGAIIEPEVGFHYSLNDAIGLQGSVGQLKAIHNNLNTPVFNVGLTLRFGTLNKGK